MQPYLVHPTYWLHISLIVLFTINDDVWKLLERQLMMRVSGDVRRYFAILANLVYRYIDNTTQWKSFCRLAENPLTPTLSNIMKFPLVAGNGANYAVS